MALFVAAAVALCCCALAPQALAASVSGHALQATLPGGSLNSFSYGGNGAIDEAAGRIYLTDYETGTVKILDIATGDLVDQITSADVPGLPFGSQMQVSGAIGVDNSGGATQGQVYVGSSRPTDTTIGRVYVFDASGNYVRTIEGDGTPQGFFAGTPFALAVDRAGRLLVSDASTGGSEPTDHYAIQRFSSSGAYLSQILVNPSDGYPSAMSADSVGNLYVQKFYRSKVDKYDPSGAYLGPIDTDVPVSVAVDVTNDHVYVANGTYITEYDASGNRVSRFGTGHVTQNANLVVDGSTGLLYDLEPGYTDVYEIGGGFTVPDVTIDPVAVAGVGYFEAAVSGEVDPDGSGGKYFFEYRRQGSNSDWSASASQAAGTGTTPIPASTVISGLQAGTTYLVRLVGIAPDGEATWVTPLESFTTKAATPPTLTIDPVSAITIDGAHLSGTVNPNDILTSAHFEYSEDGFGWTSLPNQNVGSGTAPVPIEGDLADLSPNTHYFVRLVAENPAASSTSNEVQFDTLVTGPTAVTSGAAPRTETTARLHGYVSPRKSATKYHFEFGSDSNYGTVFPEVELGAGAQQLSVSHTVTGLQPGTTYHYRLVAENAAGVTTGDDIAFTTRTAAETGPRDRGVELINNPEKGNQPARPGGSGGGGSNPVASKNADRVLWSTVGGAPGGSLGTGSVFMAERTSQGWRSANVLPPREELVDNGESPYEPIGANPAFSRLLYAVKNGVNDFTQPTITAADVDGSDQHVFGLVEPSVFPVYRANDDFSHVYSITTEQIDPTHPAGKDEVYDFSTEPPLLVSVDPNGTAVDCGLFADFTKNSFGVGAYEWAATNPAAPPRVFFESEGEAPCPVSKDNSRHGRVYMRDLASQTTVLLSGPALPGGPQGEEGAYIRANPDGTEVLFTAESRLTPDDTNDVGDIYSYSDAGGRKCLTCVGKGAAVDGRGGSNERNILASEDLSYLYFNSANVLVPGAGERGGSNLYLYHEGQLRYVSPGTLNHQTSELTADGKVLFFSSEVQEITDDDTGGYTQFYRYDAVDRSVECVSCKPGVTPTAPVLGRVQVSAARGGFGLSTANGDSLVFQTFAALERRDINLAADIYEWRNGQVRLVTDGVSEPAGSSGVSLIGQGKDNMNVIFASGNNLTGFERDNVGQLYAARIGGAGRPPTPLPPCESGDCQGPLVAPPGFAEPGSGSLNGSGNARDQATARKPKARKCAKGRKATKSQGKTKCVKAKKKAKKAKSNRGSK